MKISLDMHDAKKTHPTESDDREYELFPKMWAYVPEGMWGVKA